jgi:hypothetical protein
MLLPPRYDLTALMVAVISHCGHCETANSLIGTAHGRKTEWPPLLEAANAPSIFLKTILSYILKNIYYIIF